MSLRMLVFAGALALAAPTVFGQSQAPRINAGETVDVEVKIVPFYAADSKGRPVTDLKPEEIEIRVGGAPVTIESFDRYSIAGRSGARTGAPAPLPSRNVFLLFDAAFSTPNGFHVDSQLASRMLESWPAGDRLTLIVNGTRNGLEKKLGPILADEKGKREALATLASMQPEIRRVGVQARPQDDFGPNGSRASRAGGGAAGDLGMPQEQVYVTYDSVQGTSRAEYAALAKSYAASLGELAGQLRRVPGPKLLLIFSQGVNDYLYFSGDTGLPIGQSGLTWTDVRRQQPLMNSFRKPLAALADSGTLTLFVNADRGTGAGDPSAVLDHLAKSSGGLLFEGSDAAEVQGRLEGSTSAYYEAGFRPAGPMAAASQAPVEVTVKRPGVRVWAPASLRMREPYRELSPEEKRQMAIDLVAAGPEAGSAHTAVKLKFQSLGGKVVGQEASGARRLKFEPAWPADLSGRKLDVYNVMLAPPANGKKGQILAFEQIDGAAGAERQGIETVLEGEGERVWGILAVDPETEQAWVRRLTLKAPGRGRS